MIGLEKTHFPKEMMGRLKEGIPRQSCQHTVTKITVQQSLRFMTETLPSSTKRIFS